MVFLLKASLIIIVLWAFYKLLLERESFFKINRMYLLFGLVFVFLLPFISLPKLVNNQGIVSTWMEQTKNLPQQTPIKEPIESDLGVIAPEKQEDESMAAALVSEKKVTQGFSYWMAMIYFFGLIVLSVHLISQIGAIIYKIWKTKDKISYDGYKIINVNDDLGPRSFFNYIFINPEKYDERIYEQILEHEKVHVKKRHSIDFLLAELAIIVLWFNPFSWLFRKEVEKNIEYQTDALILQSPIIEAQNYQMNLLEIAVERKPLSIVSNYNQSLIKKRIIMMNKKKSNGHSYWKYAFIVPTLLITLLLLNQPYTLQAQESVEEVNNDNLNDYENKFNDDLKPLLRAVRHGDYTAVKKMLENGGDVNLMQRGEGTPLTMAIRSEEFKIAQLLLEKGADPNLGTKSDGYPLWMAARNGDIALVRLLISKGADVNAKFRGDGSALIQAARAGNLEMAKVLIELKADVNMSVDGDGNPLIMASRAGSLEVVEYLIAKGAAVNKEVPGDETPLIGASEQGYLDIVKYLVNKGAEVNKICIEEVDGKTRVRTALSMAKLKGHDAVVKYLINKGAVE